MTKIGGVPYFGQFMFYLKAPGKILTGDHQNTVDPCYGQYEFAGGLPPTQNPYFGQFGASPPPLSPIMVNIVLLASINPYYGQFIINWWLWGHYTAVFTICRPCYGQFIITWVLQCLYKACCGQYNLFWGHWEQYLMHIVTHIHPIGKGCQLVTSYTKELQEVIQGE